MTTKLHRQSLVAYGAPLAETIVDCPQPRGCEVLVRIERCGVCHSDLHIHDGYFRLAGDKKLDVTAGRAPPLTPRHQNARAIQSAGAEVAGGGPGGPGRRGRGVPWGRRGARAAGGRWGSFGGAAAARARRAGWARRICAPRRAISASLPTAVMPATCWCRIRAIFSTTRR